MNIFVPPEPIRHIVPSHAVTVHRISTPQEERRKHIGDKGRATQRKMSKSINAKNAAKGRQNAAIFKQLIRVCWGKPFTISLLMKKATEMNLPEINRKVYQARLLKLVESGTLCVTGRDGLEKTFQVVQQGKIQ